MNHVDRYTKIVLTIIAAALVTIACNQVSSAPGATARAAGKLASVQFSGVPIGFIAVDTNSGDVWSYDNTHGQGIDGVTHIGRIDEVGKPLVKPEPGKN